MTEICGTPKRVVINHMKRIAPERVDEIDALWKKYNPNVVLVDDAKQITLNANKDRIECDAKTMDVFWLIGFSGWKSIECYTPSVILSAASGQAVADVLKQDRGIVEVERDYKERRAAAQSLIDAPSLSVAPWPRDIPRPCANRDALDDSKYKAAFDLTYLAVGFTLFHEFRHVMFDRDLARPNDPREEELACDVWAREFMTAQLAEYARNNGFRYEQVLRKRAMGIALAALIIHEITPFWQHGGNLQYFSVADRLKTLLDNTPLPPNDDFWLFTSSLLIGIFRQKYAPIDAPTLSARELTRYLLDQL